MIIIGLLLLIAAAALGIDFVAKNDFRIADPTVFGQHLGIHRASALFIVGAVTGAAALLGVALLVAGMRRKGSKAVTRHQRRKDLRHTRDERDALRSENADLRKSLDEEHATNGSRVSADDPVERAR
jgi:hypothetical protein